MHKTTTHRRRLERRLLAAVALVTVGIATEPLSAELPRNLVSKWLSRRQASSQKLTRPPVNVSPNKDTLRAVSPPKVAKPAEMQLASHEIPPAPAADQPVSTSYTLEQLEQLAVANHPSVRQAAALVDQARGRQLQAGLYPNPSVGYVSSEVGNVGKAGQQGAFVSQEFITGGKLGLSQAVEYQDVHRLLWQLEAQQQRVRNEVRSRVYEFLGAGGELDIAVRFDKIATAGVKMAEDRLETRGTQAEVLQAQVELSNVELVALNATQQRQAAWRRLAAAVSVPDLPRQEIEGSLNRPSEERDWDTEWTRLRTSSPQFQAAQSRIQRAAALIRREQAMPIPNVDVQAGAQYDNASRLAISNVQIGVPLPLYNRNQGNIRSACAELRASEEDLARLELSQRDRLASSFRDYETWRQQADKYRVEILPKAEQALQLATDGYHLGKVDFLMVLTSRRSALDSNLAYVRALTQFRLAEVALDGLLLTGGHDAPAE